MTIITIKNLSKNFGKNKVLSGINLKIVSGTVTAIIGPSGSGKTTLIRIIALLDTFKEGEIIFHESVVINSLTSEAQKETLRHKIGIVFQDFNLWPHKTVLENITEALISVKKIQKEQAYKCAMEWLKKIDLEDKKNEFPDNLSGGQKQRVAIARTLAMEPELILFDEITAALDPELVSGILKLIKRLAKDGMTMLIITHHLKFAQEVSDQVIFLDSGKIIEQGKSTDIFYNPQNERTKEFLNQTTIEHKELITIYEGYDDFQAYHLGLLKKLPEKSTIYIVGAVGDRWYECMGKYYNEYEKLRIKKEILWKMLIYKESSQDFSLRQKIPKLSQYRILPEQLENPANYNVMEDTTIIQTFGEIPSVIEIKNTDVAKSYLNYFYILWNKSKSID